MMNKLFLTSLLMILLGACNVNGNEQDATPLASESTTAPTSLAVSSPTDIPTSTSTAVPTVTPTVTATLVPSATPEPTVTPTPEPTATPSTVVFATIGDFGQAGPGAEAVSMLIDSWEVDFIITLGDNNYPNGEAETIDENIGQYYSAYIYPYVGQYAPESTPEVNRFFPSLGNHDYYGPDGAQPYLDYFELPGNERYYDFEWGPLHLFALNSDFNEPDGLGANSVQGQWLQEQLAASTAPWKLVYFHAAPYSSGNHGSSQWMRWPYLTWGADAVLAAHDHHYERLLIDGLPYFVNGLGGGAIYGFGEIVPGSEVRFTGTHGAMRVEASAESITFEFVTADGELIDSYTMAK